MEKGRATWRRTAVGTALVAVCLFVLTSVSHAENLCSLKRAEDGTLVAEGTIDVPNPLYSVKKVRSIMVLEKEGNRAFHYVHIAPRPGFGIAAAPSVISTVAFSTPAFDQASASVVVPLPEGYSWEYEPVPCTITGQAGRSRASSG